MPAMTHRGKSNRWWIAILAAFALLVAACGDDGDDDATTDDTEAPAEDATSEEEAEPAEPEEEAEPEPEEEEEEAEDGPVVTVEPDTGLTDGTTVAISGSGYTPGLTLGITLCSAQGDATGAADCDLAGIQAVEVAEDGTVGPIDYTVIAGPFGENQRVCDPDNPCALGLGELVPDPDAERASAQLEFA